jgi:hypothetical protein
MSKIHYEVTAYKNGEPFAGFDINQNQMDMIALALADYQDQIYDEDSPYYSDKDASDFSELQSNIGEIA